VSLRQTDGSRTSLLALLRRVIGFEAARLIGCVPHRRFVRSGWLSVSAGGDCSRGAPVTSGTACPTAISGCLFLAAGRSRQMPSSGRATSNLAALVVPVRDQDLPDAAGQLRVGGDGGPQGLSPIGLGSVRLARSGALDWHRVRDPHVIGHPRVEPQGVQRERGVRLTPRPARPPHRSTRRSVAGAANAAPADGSLGAVLQDIFGCCSGRCSGAASVRRRRLPPSSSEGATVSRSHREPVDPEPRVRD
jgi:hypothetical protein